MSSGFQGPAGCVPDASGFRVPTRREYSCRIFCLQLVIKAAALGHLPLRAMASSLSPECTPLKHTYDACFNSWFQGYLQPTLKPGQEDARKEYSKAKAKEFEERCGSVWEQYRKCVAVSFFSPILNLREHTNVCCP